MTSKYCWTCTLIFIFMAVPKRLPVLRATSNALSANICLLQNVKHFVEAVTAPCKERHNTCCDGLRCVNFIPDFQSVKGPRRSRRATSSDICICMTQDCERYCMANQLAKAIFYVLYNLSLGLQVAESLAARRESQVCCPERGKATCRTQPGRTDGSV